MAYFILAADRIALGTIIPISQFLTRLALVTQYGLHYYDT